MASTSSFEPTTRSRTLLFLSYRDSDGRSRRRLRRNRRSRTLPYPSDTDLDGSDERQGLIAGDASNSSDHITVDMDLLPPRWVDISEQVEEILNGASLKISTLEKLHAKHALPGFADRSAEEREIERLTQDITRDFRQSQNLIQRVSASNKDSFPPTSVPSKDEALAAKNVQRGLAAKLQELSGRFRKKQRIYMDRLQGHAIKNQDLLIASGAVSSKGIDKMTEVEEDMQASRSQLSSQQQQQHVGPELEQRNREVAEIAKSITQLADIFKDLQTMVIDQGTILDSIEYNVEQTSKEVAEAVKELHIATQYQRSTGRRAWIFLLLLIIFGLVIVLIFKPRRHSSPTSSPPIESSL